ncbi:hypothetical protein A2U01_0059607, partial [Trifolium medium]|nr:hypothetical protein [Trifolium medium]
PNRNEFEVHVMKKSDDLHFEEGWFGLRDVYDIWFGAWVTFTYVNPKLLTISLTTRCGTEVKYPTKVGGDRGLGSSTLTTSSNGLVCSFLPQKVDSL